jgi:hypothetical protein
MSDFNLQSRHLPAVTKTSCTATCTYQESPHYQVYGPSVLREHVLEQTAEFGVTKKNETQVTSDMTSTRLVSS